MPRIIDFRSDTVTLQPAGMLEAMMQAKVGDEFYGDDLAILELQELSADLLGKERGLFLPSGTMANLVAVLTHTDRGDMLLLDALSHLYRAECGNVSMVAGLLARPLGVDLDGIDVAELLEVLASQGRTQARASLLVVENTHNALGGVCTSTTRFQEYRGVADAHQLKIHVDGARLFNACTALAAEPDELAAGADSLSFCLSKGLAAPFGSVLVGSEDFIERAGHYKQLLGGGFRQAGYFAAAGTWALRNMINRLAEDHANAQALAEGLHGLGCHVDLGAVQTNIVFFEPPRGGMPAETLVGRLVAEGEILLNSPRNNRIRLVTHYGVDRTDVATFLERAEEALAGVES